MTTTDLSTDDVPVLDLDALERPAGKIKLRRRTKSADGAEQVEWILHDVMPLDGRGADILREYHERFKAGDAGDIPLNTMRSIASDCVPSLTSDEIRWLTPKQLVVIFGLATKQTDLVRQFIAAMNTRDAADAASADGDPKNAQGPTPEAATSAGDSSPIS